MMEYLRMTQPWTLKEVTFKNEPRRESITFYESLKGGTVVRILRWPPGLHALVLLPWLFYIYGKGRLSGWTSSLHRSPLKAESFLWLATEEKVQKDLNCEKGLMGHYWSEDRGVMWERMQEASRSKGWALAKRQQVNVHFRPTAASNHILPTI